MKKKDTLEYKLLHTKMKPSDFKFGWRVFRGRYYDYDGMENDKKVKAAFDVMLDCKSSEDAKCKAAAKAVDAIKPYKKPYFYYRLCRVHLGKQPLVKAIISIMKSHTPEFYDDFMANNPNISTLKEKTVAEQQKDRSFCSLSTMQKWVDAHSLNIDVYKLYED